ncbi:hypothetical protein [Pantoea anthophila]|uniref:hypothetical protein n=1 Tax=Pantoea anthophila TaxID=470931 RepID=UPI002786FC05|nr:hypothetical protein [Pantoea anthophila]MDQ1214571.1 hypothetical protein [Pantoea anthophila]
MASKTFNLSCARASGSPMRIKNSATDHTVAHEVLLIAIMKQLEQITGDNRVLFAVQDTCEELLKLADRSSALKIATDLINEAHQQE